MLCEKCGLEIDTITCRRCGKAVLRLGSFCYQCGGELSALPEELNQDPGDIDFSQRVLCSDGACIGVINEEGVCKVCGKPYAPDA